MHLCVIRTNLTVMSDVTVESFFGATLTTSTDKAGLEHRRWFFETDGGRIVCAAEVIDHTDEDRHFVPKSRISVPESVEKAVCEYHEVDEVYTV